MLQLARQSIFLIFLISLTGCVQFNKESGAENLWRQPQSFLKGSSSTEQVLTALGPPSQVLAVGDKTIYYYLKEEVTRHGLILLIYNNTTEITVFDRAMFIFDKQGLLEDYAYSKQADKVQ